MQARLPTIPLPCQVRLSSTNYVGANRKTAKETTVTQTAGTETTEAVIHEALGVIDKALSQMMSRELVSSGEITDVLLDVRTLLTMPATLAAGC